MPAAGLPQVCRMCARACSSAPPAAGLPQLNICHARPLGSAVLRYCDRPSHARHGSLTTRTTRRLLKIWKAALFNILGPSYSSSPAGRAVACQWITLAPRRAEPCRSPPPSRLEAVTGMSRRLGLGVPGRLGVGPEFKMLRPPAGLSPSAAKITSFSLADQGTESSSSYRDRDRACLVCRQ